MCTQKRHVVGREVDGAATLDHCGHAPLKPPLAVPNQTSSLLEVIGSTAAASARRGNSATAASARSCTAASAGSSASTAAWRTAAASTGPDRQAQVPAGSTMLNAGEVPSGIRSGLSTAGFEA